MTESANWRTPIDAADFFGHQKKQDQIEKRRPVIRRAADLVGPGIGPAATRITDFNDTLATFNGFFSAEAGAANAPTTGQAYVGWVSADAELGGVQVFVGLENNNTYRRSFRRNPADSQTIYWFPSWEAL